MENRQHVPRACDSVYRPCHTVTWMCCHANVRAFDTRKRSQSYLARLTFVTTRSGLPQ